MNWVAVISHAGQQYRAARELQNQGCTVFLPECIVEKRDRKTKQKRTVTVPRLGRYLFCNPNGLAIRTVLSTRGVHSMVRKGSGEPDWIRPETMESVIALMSAVQDMTPRAAAVYVGQKLTVKDGPFAGITGTVIEILGKELKLSLTDENQHLVSRPNHGIPHLATIRAARTNLEPVG